MCIFTLWGILFTTKPPVCTLWSWFWWWGGCCLSSFSSSWPHLYLWTLHSKFLTIPSHVCTWCSYWPFWAWRWPNRRLVRVWACSGWPSLKKKTFIGPWTADHLDEGLIWEYEFRVSRKGKLPPCQHTMGSSCCESELIIKQEESKPLVMWKSGYIK